VQVGIRLIRARSGGAPWAQQGIDKGGSGQSAPSARCRSGPARGICRALQGLAWRGVSHDAPRCCRLPIVPPGRGATVDWRRKASSLVRAGFEALSSSSSPPPAVEAVDPWSRSACHLAVLGRFASESALHLHAPPGCPRLETAALLLKDPAPGGRSHLQGGEIEASGPRAAELPRRSKSAYRAQRRSRHSQSGKVWEATASGARVFLGNNP